MDADDDAGDALDVVAADVDADAAAVVDVVGSIVAERHRSLACKVCIHSRKGKVGHLTSWGPCADGMEAEEPGQDLTLLSSLELVDPRKGSDQPHVECR